MFWVVGKTFAEKVREQKGNDYDQLELENKRLREQVASLKDAKDKESDK